MSIKRISDDNVVDLVNHPEFNEMIDKKIITTLTTVQNDLEYIKHSQERCEKNIDDIKNHLYDPDTRLFFVIKDLKTQKASRSEFEVTKRKLDEVISWKKSVTKVILFVCTGLAGAVAKLVWDLLLKQI